MTQNALNRRQFLKWLGVGCATIGASSYVNMQRVLADQRNTIPPRRLIVISHCHGWPYRSWRLRPSGLDTNKPWSIDLKTLSADQWSQPLAPLYAHRHRVLAIDGLSLASAELDVDGNRHDTGWIHAWTGNNVDFSGSSTAAQSASIDQVIASHISRHDRLPSLELNIGVGLEDGRPISYAPNGQRLPSIEDPNILWQRLFGNGSGTGSLTQQRQATMDYAYNEYKALSPKLNAQDRQKLDTHFGLLERLQDRLKGMADATCQLTPLRPGSLDTYNQRFDAFGDMIATAFSCDLTRVVSLSLGEMPTADFGWDDLTDDVHKGLAHDIYNDEQKHQAMTDYLELHTKQIARLIATLEAIPDVGNTSVMDNTLIVWGSELADGWHGYRHYCPILIGGQWFFETGRYIHIPHQTPIGVLVPESIAEDGYTQFSGLPHQQLLVSIAQAFDLNIDHVGITHLQGQTGQYVNCRGPLQIL